MREIEVAIGYMGGQWDSVWVEIPDNNYVLSDEEISEKAEEAALALAAAGKRTVSFTKVLYIEEPVDDCPI
jgi:hypothetical protein